MTMIRSVAREQTGHLMKAPPYSETLPAGQPQPINQDSDSPRRTYVWTTTTLARPPARTTHFSIKCINTIFNYLTIQFNSTILQRSNDCSDVDNQELIKFEGTQTFSNKEGKNCMIGMLDSSRSNQLAVSEHSHQGIAPQGDHGLQKDCLTPNVSYSLSGSNFVPYKWSYFIGAICRVENQSESSLPTDKNCSQVIKNSEEEKLLKTIINFYGVADQVLSTYVIQLFWCTQVVVLVLISAQWILHCGWKTWGTWGISSKPWTKPSQGIASTSTMTMTEMSFRGRKAKDLRIPTAFSTQFLITSN
ncbi:uncharacterized protein LOC110863119 isoform X2 [Folsomia candida]|uniref:uncharacterized protein LOC110863119 isoform X2 n=1 Tax=Folsomia candida TaxID=158441 RepID=UPI000B903F98|nr:uncharacterized protein LOC110863119 isoform X2 [Folsomia candida]